MYTRHDEVPVLHAWQDTVEAAHYNRVLRALKRLGPGIRLQLPGLKTLELILQADAWIIVDHAFDDVPVAAWSGFRPSERTGLQEPVPCELRYFHAHAGIILKRVLALMDERLEQQLAALMDTRGGQVLPFGKKE